MHYIKKKEVSFFCFRNSFRHELTVLEKVRHPNVVQFVGAVTQSIPMMIVSELHEEVTAAPCMSSSFYFPCKNKVTLIFAPKVVLSIPLFTSEYETCSLTMDGLT
jgi:serine/threonine protein kinase